MRNYEATQPYKFRTRKWVETNDVAHGTYNTNSQIKFKTTILKSSVCDYSGAYILVKRTKQLWEQDQMQLQAATRQTDEINNMHIDNAKDLDVVISIYNLI